MAKINLNTASIKELQSLTGVGPNLAKKIRLHITKYGPLKSAKELTKIAGVSEKLAKSISSQLAYKAPESAPKQPKKRKPRVSFQNSARRMKGKIELLEPTHEPVAIEFTNTKLRGRDNKPLTEVKLQRLPHFREKEGSFVNLRVPLSRHTPPGSHTLDVLIDGVKHQTQIDVLENTSVQISPMKFYLEGAPGSSIKKRILIKNTGNLPLTFKDPGPVILETDFIECRSIRDVVRKINKKETSLEQILCAAAEKLEDLYDEGGTMRVRLDGKALTIKGGEQAMAQLVITLPAKLKRPNRYTGGFRFYNAGVTFVVIPTT